MVMATGIIIVILIIKELINLISDGERVYVEKYSDLIDDCLSVVVALYGNTEDVTKNKINHRHCKCPFVFFGISLGGAIGKDNIA